MSSGWRRVAERGDNCAFAPEEVSKALLPALKQSCRAEMDAGFLDSITAIYREQDGSLFQDHPGAQLETLRREAGCGIGRALLDNVTQLSDSGAAGLDALARAMTTALIDRAARAGRQMEEHFCRESTAPRALNVRARIEEAIGLTPLDALAREILRLDDRRPSRVALKQEGLDDGVRLP